MDEYPWHLLELSKSNATEEVGLCQSQGIGSDHPVRTSVLKCPNCVNLENGGWAFILSIDLSVKITYRKNACTRTGCWRLVDGTQLRAVSCHTQQPRAEGFCSIEAGGDGWGPPQHWLHLAIILSSFRLPQSLQNNEERLRLILKQNKREKEKVASWVS